MKFSKRLAHDVRHCIAKCLRRQGFRKTYSNHSNFEYTRICSFGLGNRGNSWLLIRAKVSEYVEQGFGI
jgi:hypothetical protein